MILFHDTDRPAALHTREGLTTYLTTSITRPVTLDHTAYEALTAKAKAEYDRSRVLYLSGGIVLETPTVANARKALVNCFNDNVGRNSGHHGLMLDGDSTVGKTTTAKALMHYVFTAYSRQRPGFDTTQTVPVAYIEVPAGCTGKLLMKTFADFYGMTVRSADSMVSIRARLINVIAAAGTQLIVVDELQNLAGRSAANGESVDVLKSLHNDLPCTFLYAGINVSSGGLLGGSRGGQMSGRFVILPMTRFSSAVATDRAEWKKLVKAFESRLPLRHHESGTLVDMKDYLFDRTNGSIGSLARLITGSAIETITNPKITLERIDKELLDTRRVDHAAETARAARLRRKADPTTTANILGSLSA